MKQISDDIQEVLYSHEEIVSACKRLAKQINEDYKDKKPMFIGLLKGAVPFMSELIKHIDLYAEIDFLKASSYNGTESTGEVKLINHTFSNIEGKDIIFVEDIIDTGLTLDVVMKEYKKKGAKSIEVATLLDKKERREVDTVKPKYIGFDVPNKFVVGFGLDYNELYRNLPYIGVLKESVYK